MMVGNNLNDVQLQQLVDRTIIKADEDFDGKISFEEFCKVFPALSIHVLIIILLDGEGLGRCGQVDNQLLREGIRKLCLGLSQPV
jgi:hypothetical protein